MKIKFFVQIVFGILVSILSYFLTYLNYNSIIRDNFKSLPEISFWNIVAVCVFIRLFFHNTTVKTEQEDGNQTIYNELGRAIVLGVLYGAYMFFTH